MNAAGIARPGLIAPARRLQILEQLDMVPAGQSQQRCLHHGSRMANDAAEILVAHLADKNKLKAQQVAKECQRPLQVRHRETRMVGPGNSRHVRSPSAMSWRVLLASAPL